MNTRTFYEFILIDSKSPKFKNRVLISDSNVGGIKNTYRIYRIKQICLFKKVFITYYKKYLGTKAFLKPYKKLWNKRASRLPKVYWGKHLFLLNMWIVLSSDYDTLSNKKVIVPDGTTQSMNVKVFDVSFKSTDLSKNLKKNQTFSINH
jgi:hypothetical protein